MLYSSRSGYSCCLMWEGMMGIKTDREVLASVSIFSKDISSNGSICTNLTNIDIEMKQRKSYTVNCMECLCSSPFLWDKTAVQVSSTYVRTSSRIIVGSQITQHLFLDLYHHYIGYQHRYLWSHCHSEGLLMQEENVALRQNTTVSFMNEEREKSPCNIQWYTLSASSTGTLVNTQGPHPLKETGHM